MEHVNDRPTPELVDDDDNDLRVSMYEKLIKTDLEELSGIVTTLHEINALDAVLAMLYHDPEYALLNLKIFSDSAIERRAEALADSDNGEFTEPDFTISYDDIESMNETVTAELKRRRTPLARRYGV